MIKLNIKQAHSREFVLMFGEKGIGRRLSKIYYTEKDKEMYNVVLDINDNDEIINYEFFRIHSYEGLIKSMTNIKKFPREIRNKLDMDLENLEKKTSDLNVI